MEVTVEVVQGLERRMTVTIPVNGIQSKVDKKLRLMAKTARMQGFRPGKVPFRMIKRQYLDQIETEVVADIIQSTYGKALLKENIRPASGPALQSRDLKDDNTLEYVMTFEIYPEIEVQGLDRIKVEKPVVTISEENVDRMIQTLRQQRTDWNEVDRESRHDDRLVIAFEGSIDDEKFDGSSAKDMPLVLGSGSMLSEFENRLVGMKAGEEKRFDVTFPEDYPGKAVAGKTAQFIVNVDSVSEPELPELDDEFARAYGVDEGGMEQFRRDVKENMQRELNQVVRSSVKNQIMDGLLENNQIEIPNALVDEEVERLRQSAREDMQRSGSDASLKLPSSVFEVQARRRVQLGLLVAKLIRTNKIEPDKEKFEEEVRTIASTYEESDVVERAYRDRLDLRQQLEAVIMENQLIDVLLEQVDVSDAAKDFYDVVQHRVYT